MRKNIAIVCGGFSGEYDISIGSAQMVDKHLDQSKYVGYKIIVSKENWAYKTGFNEFLIDKTDFSLDLDGEMIHFDGVFNAIHGTPGEDGKLQGYFDMLGIPYTSCNAATSALTFNKHFCNRFVNSYGIKTANSLSFSRKEGADHQAIIDKLGLPVFVKPTESGSSVGISKVKKAEDLGKAIDLAFAESNRIIIEEHIEGRELACGLLNRKKELIVFPLTEIISKKEFFDYEAKYTSGMADEITPAELPEEIENDIKALSSFLFREMDCKGFVRFDYILSGGELYFLEVNSIPGISEASIIPKMAKTYGMSFTEFFNIVLGNMFEG